MLGRRLFAIASVLRAPYVARPWLKWLLCVLAVYIPIWLLCYYTLDFDFGWHLQAGNYIRSHGIPSHDVFTYTASNFRWIDHEWGSDVLLSLGYNLGGWLLVTSVAAAFWAGALLLAAGRKANPLLLFVAVVATAPLVVVRPTAITVLFFAGLLVLLRRPRYNGWYWLLPLLFVIWANLHAGFISGLALLAYFTVVRRSRQLAGILLLCSAATFLNAYGVRLYEEVFRTVFDSALHSRVVEWSSFFIPKPALIFVDLWLAGFWLYDKRRLRNWFGLSPLLLLATFSASRNLTLFIVASMQQLPEYVSRAVGSIPKKLDIRRKAVLVLLSLGLLYLFYIGVSAAFITVGKQREAFFPATAVSYLRQHPCPGRLYNNYNYGGYLIWKLPGEPVYIDGRMPTWEPYMTKYTEILADPGPHYKAEFTRYNVQCALLMTAQDGKLIRLLAGDGWKTVSAANGARLLVSPQAISRME